MADVIAFPNSQPVSGTAGISYFMSPTQELMLDRYASQFSDDDSLNYAVSAGFRFSF